MTFRCQKVDGQGARCVLRPEHEGKVPCRFTPLNVTVHPPGWIKSASPAMREAVAGLVQAVAGLGPKVKTRIWPPGYFRQLLRQPEFPEMRISIPLIPPSVNHYKLPKRGGKGFYLTKEAKAFQAAVALTTQGSVRADLYDVKIRVYLGYNQKGDADNFNKVILDALVRAGIITSDAKVKKVEAFVDRDRDQPRTEIIVKEWRA